MLSYSASAVCLPLQQYSIISTGCFYLHLHPQSHRHRCGQTQSDDSYKFKVHPQYEVIKLNTQLLCKWFQVKFVLYLFFIPICEIESKCVKIEICYITENAKWFSLYIFVTLRVHTILSSCSVIIFTHTAVQFRLSLD